MGLNSIQKSKQAVKIDVGPEIQEVNSEMRASDKREIQSQKLESQKSNQEWPIVVAMNKND